jgi:tetratricopeptide (TPR) repeat protein
MLQQRQLDGKETASFKIHGRTKQIRELERLIARCHMSVPEFVAQARNRGITSSAAVRCVSPVGSGSSSGQPSSSSFPVENAPKLTPKSSSGSHRSQIQPQYDQDQEDYVEVPASEHHGRFPNPSAHTLAAAMPILMHDQSREHVAEGAGETIDHDGQQEDCDYIQQELGMMTAVTYRPDAVEKAFPDIRDLDGWELVSKPDAAAEAKVCPKCQHPCRGHSPLPETLIRDPTTGFGQMLQYQPLPPGVAPLPGSNEAAKFQAYCYAACMYGGQEKFNLLAKSLQQADRIFEEMIRKDNPMALLSVLLALTVLHAHDRGTMAASIIRSAYDVICESLGEYHPMTMTLEWLTAAAGQKLKDCRVKTARLREVKLAMQQTLDQDHPHIIVATYCLAFQLIIDKAFKEAEEILTQLADTCRRKLGTRSLQTVSTLNALGRAQKRQEKYDQAIETLRGALELRPLGPNHAYQLDSLKELAKLYKIKGRDDLMEPIYWAVLRGKIKTLGKTHSFTEEAKLDLERFLKDTSRWDAQGMAEEKVQRLFDGGPLTSDIESF